MKRGEKELLDVVRGEEMMVGACRVTSQQWGWGENCSDENLSWAFTAAGEGWERWRGGRDGEVGAALPALPVWAVAAPWGR